MQDDQILTIKDIQRIAAVSKYRAGKMRKEVVVKVGHTITWRDFYLTFFKFAPITEAERQQCIEKTRWAFEKEGGLQSKMPRVVFPVMLFGDPYKPKDCNKPDFNMYTLLVTYYRPNEETPWVLEKIRR